MSSVNYIGIDGEEVSEQWYALLDDIRHTDHVSFNVNEGHRTMARQTWFWFHQPPLAAFPSANAPHILTGRFFHAIDFNNAAGVIAAAGRRGVRLILSVPGESWHAIPADPDQLLRYWRENKGRTTLRKGMRADDDVVEVKKLLRNIRKPRSTKHYYPRDLEATRDYGLKVRRSVRSFQRNHRMKSDGVVGPKTWRALDRAPTHD